MLDQRVSEGPRINLFNYGAHTTTLPAQLSSRFDCDIIPIYISIDLGNKASIYIVYFTLPISIRLIIDVFYKMNSMLNETLEATAKLLLLYSLLFSFGIVV